eukprot:GHVR01142316.1.p2 GENE.GHVR01142316.1~~GHVR01142316.1.p2  ORF type:complete len:180 (-),score=108.93 GHVR01142316.1:332-871(-)
MKPKDMNRTCLYLNTHTHTHTHTHDDKGLELRLSVQDKGYNLLYEGVRQHSHLFDVIFETDDFFSRLLGLFERNNIDIEVLSPLQKVFINRLNNTHTHTDKTHTHTDNTHTQDKNTKYKHNETITAEHITCTQDELCVLEKILREKDDIMKYEWEEEEASGIFTSTENNTHTHTHKYRM